MVEFIVLGNPIALKRHRHYKFGTYDPSKKDKENFYLKAFRHRPIKALGGRVFADIKFYMQRPKSHYRTGKFQHLLKDNAPNYYHSKKPDIDNLIKFVLDTIQGRDRFILDDSMVCSLKAEKIYTSNNEEPRTEVKLFELEGGN